MKCFTSFAWSGNIDSFGCGDFDSKRIDEKTKELIKNSEPACERGISPGEEG
jgi:hypothetical protein